MSKTGRYGGGGYTYFAHVLVDRKLDDCNITSPGEKGELNVAETQDYVTIMSCVVSHCPWLNILIISRVKLTLLHLIESIGDVVW